MRPYIIWKTWILSYKNYRDGQFHWNNPYNVEIYKDSSGIRLYYTSKLRQFNAGVMVVGKRHLEIPPKSQDVVTEGRCPSECSREIIIGPISVFWAMNHMHFLGHKMKMEVFRDGVFYTQLTNEDMYSYDEPIEFKYSTAVLLLPGNEIVTICHFKSLSKSRTTFYGDATSDEMCFGFLSFYPVENMTCKKCVSWKSISTCNAWILGSHEGCNWYKFLTNSNKEYNATKNLVKEYCRPFVGCTLECNDLLRNLYAEHPCMKGDIYQYIRRKSTGLDNWEMQHFMAAAHSCAVELAVEALGNRNNGDNTNGSRGLMTANYVLLVFLPCILLFQ